MLALIWPLTVSGSVISVASSSRLFGSVSMNSATLLRSNVRGFERPYLPRTRASYVPIGTLPAAGDDELVGDGLRLFVERSRLRHFRCGGDARMREVQLGDIVQVAAAERDFNGCPRLDSSRKDAVQPRGRQLGEDRLLGERRPTKRSSA